MNIFVNFIRIIFKIFIFNWLSNLLIPLEFIIEASTPSPDVPLIKPKDVYIFFAYFYLFITIFV